IKPPHPENLCSEKKPQRHKDTKKHQDAFVRVFESLRLLLMRDLPEYAGLEPDYARSPQVGHDTRIVDDVIGTVHGGGAVDDERTVGADALGRVVQRVHHIRGNPEFWEALIIRKTEFFVESGIIAPVTQPLDNVVAGIAITARRGSGKTVGIEYVIP